MEELLSDELLLEEESGGPSPSIPVHPRARPELPEKPVVPKRPPSRTVVGEVEVAEEPVARPSPMARGPVSRSGDATVPQPQEVPLSEPDAPASRRRRHYGGESQEEDGWASGQTMSLWWVLAGGGCIAVIWIFLSQTFDTPVNPEALKEPNRHVMSDDLSDVPIADFVARSTEILPVITEMMEKASKVEGSELVPLIRGGENSAALRGGWLARKALPARHHPVSQRQLHAASSAGSPYLIMAGLDKEHLESVAYFVSDNGEFKFDWEASEGYSELLPGEEEKLSDNEPKLMRAIVRPSTFYTPQFPEEKFQSYMLHHRDPGQFVWAFALRSSEANTKLRSFFDIALRSLPSTRFRVTVRVRKGPEGARANQLEIVEYLHPDWFTPEEAPDQ